MRTPTTTSHPRRARAWRVRLTAAAGALALLFSGMVGATAAMADTRMGTQEKGSLTIHKLVGADADLPNNGEEITDIEENYDTLAGVQFTVTQVLSATGDFDGDDISETLHFDLSVGGEGWENMRKAGVQDDVTNIANGAANGSSVYTYETEPRTLTTGPDGIAKYEDLPLGLYIVRETANAHDVVSSTAPFLVTIPLNIADDDGEPTDKYLYDVHVYPKNNTVDKPIKTVKPEGNFSKTGVLTWTVSQKVPTLLSTDSIDSFVIVDTLDSRLAFHDDPAVVTLAGTPLDAADYTVNIASNTMTVTFTNYGIDKLEAAQGETVSVSFKSTASAPGEYENNAYTNINGSKYHAVPKTAKWGGLRILKYDGEEDIKAPSNTMDGAEFALYDVDPSLSPSATPIATGVTKDGGTFEFKYLWIGEEGATSKTYWLLETKAPAGYVLDDVRQEIEVKIGEESVGYFTEVEVLNYRIFIPGLPLTGAQGTAIIIAVGITFLVAAAGLLILRNRRSHSA